MYNEDETIIEYIYLNYHKFLLFLFVFIIIYCADYVSHLNTIMYLQSQMPKFMTKKGKK
jgi:hypothetical protein